MQLLLLLLFALLKGTHAQRLHAGQKPLLNVAIAMAWGFAITIAMAIALA